ncbi:MULTISPECIES: serine hydrolase [Huintestinicola]|uniref:D-alanyl-D-alanine carboxypeptidase family protein n=1 Tax=Huintestinicola TaxID=2981636 RepID=UPI0015B3D680|nr:serine hydrolase [Huintestinicola butyrica]MCU6727118.1 serine hydrolase [Huintestinicola butyrica]
MLKKILSVISASVIMMSAVNVSAETISEEYSRSYVLMEAETHTVIRENNGDKRVKMGSFNKLMTVLLAAEAMDRGELSLETELVTSEHANSMQGAQIWLMPGEKMALGDLLKGVIIGNANDACCVIAEKISGSEEKFTELMNSRAAELGMNDTLFTECTGYYGDDAQYTTAHDAALLLCELSKHNELTEMFTSRIDELKGGEVQLVTANRMGHRYKGSVGFKCGTGPSSGYFAAEGARRDDICFVTAVMDCPDEDIAMALAKELLDIGFDGYMITSPPIPDDLPESILVKQGCAESVRLAVEPVGNVVVSKGSAGNITARISLPTGVYAPLKKGDKVGELRLYIGKRLLKTCDICAAEYICKKDFKNVLSEMLKNLFCF